LFGALSLFTNCSHEDKNRISMAYDMRADLAPQRLTIAMWDYSWLFIHYKGGAFEDFNKVTDELLERGFNTVRIDVFPLIFGKLSYNNQQITIAGDQLRNWGASDIDRKHDLTKELLEFMEITKQKKINVILSTWGNGCKEFPNIKQDFTTKEKYWAAWEKVLNLLSEHQLLDHVCYVDLDQEFPYFSPFSNQIENLKNRTVSKPDEFLLTNEAMEQAGKKEDASGDMQDFKWNTAQMKFVKTLMGTSLSHFQEKYPGLRFTYSLTDFWKEVRALKITSFDVLELHFWMSSDERFLSRTTFDKLVKDRGNHDYSDYKERVNNTLKAIRPMMLKGMHNRLSFAKSWSDEIGAPLTTTEAWGPWWQMDNQNEQEWKWLYDWCEECMNLSSEYHLWGATPWNYSHPYWHNWSNIEWYKRVNADFLKL